jgi:hypothetical protein
MNLNKTACTNTGCCSGISTPEHPSKIWRLKAFRHPAVTAAITLFNYSVSIREDSLTSV